MTDLRSVPPPADVPAPPPTALNPLDLIAALVPTAPDPTPSVAATPAKNDKGLHALVLFIVTAIAATIGKKWGYTVDAEWVAGLITTTIAYTISTKTSRATIAVAETKAETERQAVRANAAMSPEAAVAVVEKMLVVARGGGVPSPQPAGVNSPPPPAP